VLYEMLAGEPPHTGGSAQAIIMKIVTDDPRPVTELRRSVPAHVAHALARALEKVPADRFETAAAFGAALADEHYTHRSSAATGARRRVTASLGAPGSRAPLMAMGAVTAAALVVAAWGWLRRPPPRPAASVQLTLDVGGKNPDIRRLAVSPDGRAFAVATDEGLAIRDAGERVFKVIPGTLNAESPAFSPDGQWIAFAANGRLRKVAVSGRMSLPLVPGDSTLGGWPHWGDDGTIAYLTTAGIHLIPPTGGAPVLLRGTAGAQVPRLLPDGSGVLYLDSRAGSRLVLFDRAADSSRVVVPQSSAGQYVSSGHLVYGHPAGGLFAVPFDLKRREVTGTPVPLIEDIRISGSNAPFAVSRSGTLVYRTGIFNDDQVIRLDPGGRVDTLPLTPRIIGYLRFSPDGQSLAITAGSARGTDRQTSIYDLSTGSMTQVTFEGGGHSPVWSPDGRRLAFTAEGTNTDAEDLFVRPLDGSKPPFQVTRLPGDQHASAWPADSMLLFTSEGDVLRVDPNAADPKPLPYLTAEWAEETATVSPDGRYAAYVSEETGSAEVFIRGFPVAGGQWKISEGGGRQPRWGPDGRTLYYQAGVQVGTAGITPTYERIVAARVADGPPFTVLSRKVVLSLHGLTGPWDVDRRTGRAVAAQAVRSEDAKVSVVVVVNWLDELRARVAATRDGRQAR
jgi:serine/threonine-protein kinase